MSNVNLDLAAAEAAGPAPSRSGAGGVTSPTAIAPSVQFLPADLLTDACVRYRCEHLQEQLGLEGVQAGIASPRSGAELTLNADVLVLNRSRDDEWRVSDIASAARSRGKALVYGTDDLLFSPEFVSHHIRSELSGRGADGMSAAGHALWQGISHHVTHIREGLLLCDCALVTTEYLAGRVEELGRPAYVVRNGLSREMEGLSRAVRRDRSRTGGRVMLGYLSGTATHNADFGDIAPVLADLMTRRWEVYLTVVGPMAMPECLTGFGTRIRRLPFVPWRDLPALIGELDVNLAPLDMLQAFNHAKSEIKWMEAAAVGVPTVASATAGFAEAVADGRTGFLAGTPRQWGEALEALVADAALRARIGEAAREVVYARYTAEALAPHTVRIFTEIADRFADRAAGSILPVTIPPPAPSRPSRPSAARLLGQVRREAGLAVRNTRRVLSPRFWSGVLDRWEAH